VARAEEGKLVLERMEFDAEGFPQPTEEFEDLEADALVLAMGQESDLSLLSTLSDVVVDDAVVDVDADRMTGHAGVFAGGDYDYCKGCGLCAAECPCGAIDMVPERI